MSKLKYTIFMLLCVLMLSIVPETATATETNAAPNTTTESTETNTDTGIFEIAEAGTPTFQTAELPSLSKSSKKTKITWTGGYGMAKIYGYEVSYEIQRSTSKKFTKATTKSIYTSKEYYNFKRSDFSDNGGTFYFRVRMWLNRGKADADHSPWSETQSYNYVKINKTNFPGMYKLLKNGGYTYIT